MANTKKKGIMQSIKNKIINGSATVLSTPARLKSNKIQRQATNDTQTLKDDRAIGKRTPYPYDESNPEFRTRINAIHVRERLKRQSINN